MTEHIKLYIRAPNLTFPSPHVNTTGSKLQWLQNPKDKQGDSGELFTEIQIQLLLASLRAEFAWADCAETFL